MNEEERATYTLQFKNCSVGLGIKVIGGLSEEEEDDADYGIFIRSVLPGGVAALDGRVQEGDQIVRVNDQDLERVTNEEAVTCLRVASASDVIELVICRDERAKEEYASLLNNYSYSCASSVLDHSPPSSINPDTASKSRWGVPEGQAHSCDSSSTPINSPKQAQETEDMNFDRKRAQSTPPYDTNLPHMTSPRLTSSHVTSPRDHVTYMGHGASAAPPYLFSPGSLYPAHHSMPHHHASTPLLPHSPPDGASGGSQASHGLYESHNHSYLNRSHNGYSETRPRAGLYRKPTLDTSAKLPVEKLEVALLYLGLQPSEQQKAELRSRLRVDHLGMVSYGEFVQEARALFHAELTQRGLTPGALFVMGENLQHFNDFSYHMASAPSSARALESEIQRVRAERDQLRHEITRLQTLLIEKERAFNTNEEELLRVKKETQNAVQESRSLRSKLHLVESAQRSARTTEQDYIEVVALLEAEVAQLKANKAKIGDTGSLQKRNTVLTCQLRKAELGRKAYEVTTDKLLQFAQTVQDTLAETESGSNDNRHRSSTYRELAKEAKETIKAVKTLLQSEPLPYGWEEAYTPEGEKYFINHVTQSTTWQHPVTHMQQTGQSADTSPDPAAILNSNHSSNINNKGGTRAQYHNGYSPHRSVSNDNLLSASYEDVVDIGTSQDSDSPQCKNSVLSYKAKHFSHHKKKTNLTGVKYEENGSPIKDKNIATSQGASDISKAKPELLTKHLQPSGKERRKTKKSDASKKKVKETSFVAP